MKHPMQAPDAPGQHGTLRGPVLDLIREKGITRLRWLESDKLFLLEDEADGCYTVAMDRTTLRELGEELIAAADQMPEEK